MSHAPAPAAARAAEALVGIGWRQPHYGELLQRPALPIGFVEVHSENFFAEGGAALAVLQAGRERLPLSLHGVGLGLASAAGLDPWHLDRLERLVQRVQPRWVSDHLAFARAPLRPGAAPLHAADLLPPAFTDAGLDIVVDNVQRVQERLKRPLLVENLSAYLRWTDDAWPEGAFLAELARRSGCGLLLDLNNLVVNALNDPDGADPHAAAMAVVRALPPEAVGELHLAGHCRLPDLVIDDHGSRVDPLVWRVYRAALRHLGPKPTLIEWDTDVPALDVLLDEAATAAGHLQAAAPWAPAPGTADRPWLEAAA